MHSLTMTASAVHCFARRQKKVAKAPNACIAARYGGQKGEGKKEGKKAIGLSMQDGRQIV